MASPVKSAFTLIELLVVIAIILILAAILFPVFAQAKQAAKQATCLSNLRQLGIAYSLYKTDWDELHPDRTDLKATVGGGWHPWTTQWPPSDMRCGWAIIILDPYLKNGDVWSCPSVKDKMSGVIQVEQTVPTPHGMVTGRYWLQRFDRPTYLLKEFWGKSDEQAIADLQTLNDPLIGYPTGVSDTLLIDDPYFPNNDSLPPNLLGLAAHPRGRNDLYLDLHAKFLADARLTQ